MTDPGWYPDPWQPGGWRYHDGNEWTSWTGPPPLPYGGFASSRTTAADVESESRMRPVGQLAMVAWAAAFAAGGISGAIALRDLFDPLIDLFRISNPSDAQIEAAVEEIQDNQAEYWWLNLVSFVPLLCLAGLAVWSNKVASIARGLGYPARRSPGWAAGGWFVPVVNLWFPYQSIVDSVSPTNPRRGRVLRWWLAYTVGGFVGGALLLVVLFSDVSPGAIAAPVAVVGLLQAVLGLQVVALVHDDHEAAISAAR